MKDKITRVLMIAPENMGYGGVQNVIMQLIRELVNQNVLFDVVVFGDMIGCFESEIEQVGCIYRVPIQRRFSGIAGVAEQLRNERIIFKRILAICKEHGSYDAIHCQYLFEAAPCLKAAKKAGIAVRIAHSHTEQPGAISFGRRIINGCQRHIINSNATIKLGVTKGACDYLYGKDKSAKVIKNPVIDLQKFNPSKYSDTVRELSLIHVGHFGPRKNELFSIEVLHYLKQLCPGVMLTFVGFSGDHPDYFYQMKKSIKEFQLEDSVVFLPSDTDMPLALSKSLYMLIPSISEGLPIVALEAQSMGVHCFISSNVSEETNQGLATFLSLELGAEKWAKAIYEFYREHGNRKRFIDMSHYDHKKICEEYRRIYVGEGKAE
jgi:glycosyltransferase EpsF